MGSSLLLKAAALIWSSAMKLSVVLSTQQTSFQAATLSGGLEDNMKWLAALGYEGVELAIREPKMVSLPDLLALTSKYNLAVPAVGTGQAWNEEGLSFTDPDPKVRQAAIERIKSHVPVAAGLGAVIIIGLVRGIIKPGVSQEQGMDWVVEALQACSQEASTMGVRLALEPINRYETSLINNVAQGLDLIERVGADNFGLLLDTFHMNIEEPSIEESIRAAGERIFHFHVADSNRLYPGGGHLDFHSILKTLKDSGYKSFVSGEFMAIPDGQTATEKSIAALKPIMQSLI